MKTKNTSFSDSVKSSRALSQEQKELLLADPPLPEGYRRKVADILRKFDERSKAREADLKDKLDELYTAFMQQVDASDLDDREKTDLKEKAKKINSSFFHRTA